MRNGARNYDWCAGKSVYPLAPVGLYQADIRAAAARGHPRVKRSTRSGLLMNGRPKAIKSAFPVRNRFLRRLLRVAAVAHQRTVKDLAEFCQRHRIAQLVEPEAEPVHHVQVAPTQGD